MSTTEPQRSWSPTDIGIDGPTSLDMFRAFTKIRADPLAFLTATQDRYGDVVAFPVPGPPVLLVSDPVEVRAILQAGAGRWGKETVQYAALAQVTGPGLLASSSPSWMEHRRLAAPAFHHRRLDAVADHVRAATDDALASWSSPSPRGQTTDVGALTLRLALDVVGRSLFSTDLSDRAQRLLAATGAAAELVVRSGRSVLPMPSWAPVGLNRQLRVARTELDQLCFDLIADRRRSGSSRDDLLTLLLDSGLTDQEIRDELVTMVVAGHETIAAALSWGLMLLAENQEAQDAVRAEATGRSSPVSMLGAATEVPRTRAVVDETLRLFPAAWVVSRRSRSAEVIAGTDVPPGTMVILSPWLMHRDPRAWSDPLDFRPERFPDLAPAAAAAYLPFGVGQRMCIGREFALCEMVIVLSRLVSRYRVTVPHGWVRPAAQAAVAVRPHPRMALVVERI